MARIMHPKIGMTTPEITLPVFASNQRVLLEHTTGPHAGLVQIIGHSAEFEGKAPPAFTPVLITPAKRETTASLIRVTPRAVYYRETRPSNLLRFNEEQV
jgi:hypothetical protein